MVIPKAVIFDMDGLMFDTERLGMEAWQHINQKLNLKVTRELALRLIGLPWDSIRTLLLSELDDFDFDYVQTQTLAYVDRSIDEQGIPIKAGLFELLSYLEESGLKKAVATSSAHDTAMFCLKKAGVDDRFDVIVTREAVASGKPAPDIYLHTARLLNAEPANCIVLEDSIHGVRAAHAANMLPIMIPDLVQPDKEIEALLHAKLDSLADVIPLLKGYTV